MNLVGLTAEPVCPTGRKIEPQRTQNAQRAAVPNGAKTMRSTIESGMERVRNFRVSVQGVTPPQSFASFAFFAVQLPCSCRHHLAGPSTPAEGLAPGAAATPMRAGH